MKGGFSVARGVEGAACFSRRIRCVARRRAVRVLRPGDTPPACEPSHRIRRLKHAILSTPGRPGEHTFQMTTPQNANPPLPSPRYRTLLGHRTQPRARSPPSPSPQLPPSPPHPRVAPLPRTIRGQAPRNRCWTDPRNIPIGLGFNAAGTCPRHPPHPPTNVPMGVDGYPASKITPAPFRRRLDGVASRLILEAILGSPEPVTSHRHGLPGTKHRRRALARARRQIASQMCEPCGHGRFLPWWATPPGPCPKPRPTAARRRAGLPRPPRPPPGAQRSPPAPSGCGLMTPSIYAVTAYGSASGQPRSAPHPRLHGKTTASGASPRGDWMTAAITREPAPQRSLRQRLAA